MQDIKIKYQRWGKNEGNYTGSISFENGDNESFCFKLTPEIAKQFIGPISELIISTATDLGEKLKKSLDLGDKKLK